MRYEIVGNPDYGQLTVGLDPGESFIAEAGSMSWMDPGTEMKSRLLGGVVKAAIRRVVGGESLFVGEYSHPRGGSITFSPSTPGSVLSRTLSGDSLYLTAGSFMACTPGVQLQTRFGGLTAFFSGEGAFFLECTGQGELFFNSYGAVIEKQVNGALVVDTGHVVGWDPTLEYTIGGMGSIKSTLMSGEGLVMRFTGSGKIYLQTRTMGGLAGWLSPQLR